MVFNKIDAYSEEKIDEDDLVTEKTEVHYSLEEWEQTWMNRLGDNVLFISALNQENIEDFKKKIYEAVREIHVTRFPYNSFLYPEYDAYVEEEKDEEE
jgi:GTP-binding protein HflX